MGDCSFCFDSDDTVMEILSWLPVMSLARFRCVCKSWRVLIKSDFFIKKHLEIQHNFTSQNNEHLFVTTFQPSCPVFWIPSSNTDKLPAITLDLLPFSYSMILGPVNGFYCAINTEAIECSKGDEKKSMCLFNLSLRESKSIPFPIIDGFIFDCISSFGFGFDSSTNDFKVVVLVSVNNYVNVFALVYSLASNSWTDNKEGVILNFYPCFYGTATYVNQGNGVVLWLVKDVLSTRCTILSYNLASGILSTVKLPREDMCYMNLKTIFMDSLQLVYVYLKTEINAQNGEIWVMNEYGNAESWTKLYDIKSEPRSRLSKPAIHRKNDKIIFIRWNDSKNDLVSYDPRNQKIEGIDIGCPRQVIVYMESLVSINNGYLSS